MLECNEIDTMSDILDEVPDEPISPSIAHTFHNNRIRSYTHSTKMFRQAVDEAIRSRNYEHIQDMLRQLEAVTFKLGQLQVQRELSKITY